MLPYALAALIWIGLFGDVSWKMRALRGGVGFLCLAALVGAWVARNDNLLGRHRSQYGGRLSVLDGAQCTDLLTLSRGEHRSEHAAAYEALSREEKETLEALSTDELAKSEWFLPSRP
jgi:4-amino-4-deoxy-L-arabinose transferase-like glycosyltransferase